MKTFTTFAKPQICLENIPCIKTLSFFKKMFVKSEHYNARKEETLNDEGQVISTKVKWDCKHCGWSSRDNATDMKKHLTKCQITNSGLKESMKTQLREGSYKKRVRPSTWEDEAEPEGPTSDLNPAKNCHQ